jgi:hypothetical protein
VRQVSHDLADYDEIVVDADLLIFGQTVLDGFDFVEGSGLHDLGVSFLGAYHMLDCSWCLIT